MNRPLKGRTGLDRLVHASLNSWNGLRVAYAGESAFRQEIWAGAFLLPAAFWLGRGPVEIALLVAAVLLVLIVELLNSAIEAVVDRVSLEWHELSKRAKDIGSAAVLLALLLCAGLWLAVAAERLMAP
jgi:diacylglycerol kinase (ATP)